MPAVEGLQQERRALSPERDLALPFSRGGELRGRSHTWRLCTSPYSCSVSPVPRPLFSGRRAQRTVAYVTIVYVPLQLLRRLACWGSSAVSNAVELGSDVRRTTTTRAWLWFELVGRARQGAGRVANGRTYPYLRGDLEQAARGGLGGGGRCWGDLRGVWVVVQRLALRLLHLQGDGSIGDLYVRSHTWR